MYKPPPPQIHFVAQGAYGGVYRIQIGTHPPFALKVAADPSSANALVAERSILTNIQRQTKHTVCARFFPRPVPDAHQTPLLPVLQHIASHMKTDWRYLSVMSMEMFDDALTFDQLAKLVHAKQKKKPIPDHLAFFLQPHVLRQTVQQIPQAFLCLFRLGYAHTDAHGGNLMIVANRKDNSVQVKLIDFGMVLQTQTALSPYVAASNAFNLRNWYTREVDQHPKMKKRKEKMLYYWTNLSWIVDGTYNPIPPQVRGTLFGDEIVTMFRAVQEYTSSLPMDRNAKKCSPRAKASASTNHASPMNINGSL
jgi:hypothetical protein